ncbi:MAG: hypothetical protein EBU08_04325 [Micrococcales bacterium]|nr:hypothetical protein [Micrococcales bacterium]NBR23011.1 hypothetical protein [Micrococcales bacterium]NBR77936.1 hypothetical protein [Microbacteriaceae bacterium]NBS85685.1 hypothetical protein [Micrococcales bacterium]NBX95121.1 hypothetical protein [Actinomycetota bacterium]
MNTNESQLKLLSIGLKKSRTQRILEEYQSDAQLDPNAKRTAIFRILKSYFWVSYLSAPLVFLIGAIGFMATFRSLWLWASCLLLASLFTTQSTSEETLASKTFKLYKLFVGFLVLVACYFSIRFDNTSEWGLTDNLDFYLGSTVYIVGGAIALVAFITIAVELFKSEDKLIQTQRLVFVLFTVCIYLSSNYTAFYPYSFSYLIQASLTALLFTASSLKRKPALA